MNPDLFEKNVEKKATRTGYGEGLVLAAEKNKNIVALTADLTESTRVLEFAEKFPERFFEVGIAEQNLATIAAGLGVSGKIPFISSYAVFSPGRNWEQIRTTVAFNDANVKIAGHHAGVSAGADGATHQALEDVATMRVMPNMKVIVPCDAIEARKATIAASQIWGPIYLRFFREESPLITTEETPFIPGKAEILWDTTSLKLKPQVLIIGCGPILYNALLAAKELAKDKIGSIVLNSHTIKPLDEKKILELARKTGAVVSVEEHQVSGGLGGALAELFAKTTPIPIEFIGMPDSFGESGTFEELLLKHGMDMRSIKAAARRAIKRK